MKDNAVALRILKKSLQRRRSLTRGNPDRILGNRHAVLRIPVDAEMTAWTGEREGSSFDCGKGLPKRRGAFLR